jgi:RNA polymerase sigma factor (sigma-70 family)
VVHGEQTVTNLVEAARRGDKRAWDAIVDRFAPLVWSVCLRHGLSPADAQDVGQGVWLRLVEQLDRIRDPAALPGWLVTTTRRECYRVHEVAVRRDALERRSVNETLTSPVEPEVDDWLFAAERQAALRDAFADLGEPCRRLLALLFHDPPIPYAVIGRRMDMPVGSIGPRRSRCLDRLRRHPALRHIRDAEAGDHDQGVRDD